MQELIKPTGNQHKHDWQMLILTKIINHHPKVKDDFPPGGFTILTPLLFFASPECSTILTLLDSKVSGFLLS